MARERVKSILVATDLGEGSEAISAAAAAIAQRAGAELHTIHSLELPWEPSEDVMRRSGFFGQIEDAERRLREQGQQVLGGQPPASEQVIIYVAHRAILDRAEEVSADLIVLGRQRRGGRRPSFVGTTADHVVRSSRVPCLIIGETAHFPVSRVGVATDFSPSADEALQLAFAWSPELRTSGIGEADAADTIRLVHVAHPMILASDPDLAKAIPQQLSDQIERALRAQGQAPAREVTAEVLWEDAAGQALVEWVNREEIGVLVMGTHGPGFFARALLGSLATSMARLTPCPVLLVPPPAPQPQPD